MVEQLIPWQRTCVEAVCLTVDQDGGLAPSDLLTSFSNALPPQGSTTFKNSTTNWDQAFETQAYEGLFNRCTTAVVFQTSQSPRERSQELAAQSAQ